VSNAARLAIAGAVLWISYSIALWPLPSRIAAETIAHFKELLAQPPWSLPDWESRPEWERKSTREGWAEAEAGLRKYVEHADEFEVVLWVKWALKLSLIAFGLAGWLLYFRKARPWKLLVTVTVTILVLGQIFFHSAVYSELFRNRIAGYTGFKFHPWWMALLTLYQYFVLPILLVAVAAFAFRRRWNESVVQSAEGAV